MIAYEVVKRFKLPARIDGHHPVGVTYRITGGIRTFRLTVITVNWGRGYNPETFKRAVLDLMNKVGDREYVVILFQELDEEDAATEHVIAAHMMEKGTTLVRWETREPIAVSPGVSVKRKRKVMTMDQGTKIGGPVGTGPRRYYVSCVVVIEGIIFGFGNQHPHRYSITNAKVDQARREGEGVVEQEIAKLVEICDIVIDGGDLNTTRYPKQHRRQRITYRVGYDYIRTILKRQKNN